MGILWFTACQSAKGTQTGYGAMPAMPQQGEDGCKECTLNTGENTCRMITQTQVQCFNAMQNAITQ
jgi:hypothetical protein